MDGEDGGKFPMLIWSNIAHSWSTSSDCPPSTWTLLELSTSSSVAIGTGVSLVRVSDAMTLVNASNAGCPLPRAFSSTLLTRSFQ